MPRAIGQITSTVKFRSTPSDLHRYDVEWDCREHLPEKLRIRFIGEGDKILFEVDKFLHGEMHDLPLTSWRGREHFDEMDLGFDIFSVSAVVVIPTWR